MTWKVSLHLAQFRYAPTGTVLNDGRVLVTSGRLVDLYQGGSRTPTSLWRLDSTLATAELLQIPPR